MDLLRSGEGKIKLSRRRSRKNGRDSSEPTVDAADVDDCEPLSSSFLHSSMWSANGAATSSTRTVSSLCAGIVLPIVHDAAKTRDCVLVAVVLSGIGDWEYDGSVDVGDAVKPGTDDDVACGRRVAVMKSVSLV